MDPLLLRPSLIATIGPIHLRMLGAHELDALKQMESGDLSHAQGEWLFPRGREEEFLTRWLQGRAEGKSFRAGICRDGKLLGVVALRHGSNLESTATLSYAMDANYRRQGMMTQACERLIAFGFGTLALDSIEILLDVGNKPSLALAEKLGFHRVLADPGTYAATSGARNLVLYRLHPPDRILKAPTFHGEDNSVSTRS